MPKEFSDKPPEGISHVQEEDSEYLRLRDLEVAFWSKDYGFGPTPTEDEIDNVIVRYTNKRFTGNENRFWYEKIQDYGPFTNALVLGAGGTKSEAIMLETNPSTHFTFCELTPFQTKKRQDELEDRFPGRVTTQTVDLNFPDFPENTYDLIISSGTIHHLVNLEDLALQINQTLTPSGYFFLQDYVGESRFKFPPEKKRAFEFIYARACKRKGITPAPLEWGEVADGSHHSPFEAVRSEDTLKILRASLIEESIKTAGAVAGLMLFAHQTDVQNPKDANLAEKLRQKITRRKKSTPKDEEFRDILLIDELTSETGLLRPTNAFAIYRKRI